MDFTKNSFIKKDYIIEKFLDVALDKFVFANLDKKLEETNLKKCLEKSVQDCTDLYTNNGKKSEYELSIDFEPYMLDSIKKENILPNFTIDELETNLALLFKQCIHTDDKDLVATIKKNICCTYKMYTAEYITLGQVDCDVHKVEQMVADGNREITRQIEVNKNKLDRVHEDVVAGNRDRKKLSEDIKKSIEKLRSDGMMPLSFIEELDKSRRVYLISVRFAINARLNSINIDEEPWEDDEEAQEYIEEVAEKIYAEGEVERDDDDGTFYVAYFYFLEPMTQSEIKEVLEVLDEEFDNKELGIINVYTYM